MIYTKICDMLYPDIDKCEIFYSSTIKHNPTVVDYYKFMYI